MIEMAGIYLTLALIFGCGYGVAHTPPIRLFGTEKAVYGIDWGSLACKADNVYGGQLSAWGGGVTDSLYGLQCGILATGYVTSNKLDRCCVSGFQYGTIAAKSATVYGGQLSGCLADATTIDGLQLSGIVGFADVVAGMQCAGFMTKTKALYGVQASMLCLGEDVHGCQLGIVNKAKRIDGLQIGIYNEASAGECLQLGVVNCMPSRKIEYLPILNLRFK